MWAHFTVVGKIYLVDILIIYDKNLKTSPPQTHIHIKRTLYTHTGTLYTHTHIHARYS